LPEKEYNPKIKCKLATNYWLNLKCESNLAFTRYVSVKKSFLFMIVGLIVLLIYLYFYIGISQIELVLKNVNSTQYVFYYSLALVAVLASVFFGRWLGTASLDRFQSIFPIDELTCIIGLATLQI
jgi:hypothetical protein